MDWSSDVGIFDDLSSSMAGPLLSPVNFQCQLQVSGDKCMVSKNGFLVGSKQR